MTVAHDFFCLRVSIVRKWVLPEELASVHQPLVIFFGFILFLSLPVCWFDFQFDWCWLDSCSFGGI